MSDSLIKTTESIREEYSVNYDSLTISDQQRLVGVFAWLINQDKKQNPENYQINQKENYD